MDIWSDQQSDMPWHQWSVKITSRPDQAWEISVQFLHSTVSGVVSPPPPSDRRLTSLGLVCVENRNQYFQESKCSQDRNSLNDSRPDIYIWHYDMTLSVPSKSKGSTTFPASLCWFPPSPVLLWSSSLLFQMWLLISFSSDSARLWRSSSILSIIFLKWCLVNWWWAVGVAKPSRHLICRLLDQARLSNY